ncbi:MAG: alpha-E domain-containing protein [Planctomycetota bacterium]
MLSRVADSVYWMNRQIERAENVARSVETALDLALEGTISHGRLWTALVSTFGDQEVFQARHGAADQASVISFLAFDTTNPNSIAACLHAARENARTVRDMISSAMWEEINKAHLEVQSAARRYGGWLHPREFLEDVKRASQLITGVADATMSHGEAWHFGRLGRLVERADKTSRVLDVETFFLQPAAGGPPADQAAPESLRPERNGLAGEPAAGDAVRWSAVLESASALEMYRKQYGAVSRRNVAEFLIFDRFFPRAMHFCLMKAEESLLAITGGSKGSYTNPAEQQLGRLRAKLDYGAIDEVLAGAGGLHGFLDGFQTRLNRASDAIHETFFAIRPLGHPAETAT